MTQNTERDVAVLRGDMKSMYDRWLRVESKYDHLLSAQRRINIKLDIVLMLQVLILILLGVM